MSATSPSTALSDHTEHVDDIDAEHQQETDDIEVDEEQHDSYWQPDNPVGEDENETKEQDGSYAVAAATVVEESTAEDEFDVAGDDTMLDEEEIVLMDESEQPKVGDLTATFFSELAAAQNSVARDRKRRRGLDSDADSDEEYGLQQRRAFHIPPYVVANFDPTAVPQSAEEYLLQVRMQADACPSVKRSDIDPKQFEHKQTPYMPHLTKALRPQNLACLPNEEWTIQFAHQFAEARQSLLCFAARNKELKRQRHGLPNRNDFNNWMKYCLGSSSNNPATATAAASTDASSATPASASTPQLARPNCPSLALVVSLEQVECKGILMHLLSHGAEEIERRQRKYEKALRQQQQQNAASIATSDPAATTPAPLIDESSPFPTHSYALWIYTLLLKVDKPISDTLAGEMRSCYRRLSWMRAHNNLPTSDVVKYCNMIMTLCDQFGQKVEMQ